MMKRLFWFVLLLGVLALAGCEGATRTSNVQSRCSSVNVSGTCTVTIGSIEGGAYRYVVENSRLRTAGGTVMVTAVVSTGTGTLEVWVEDRDENRTSVTVEPGETVELVGLARVWGTGDEREFRVFFEPQMVDGVQRAENVEAEISYEVAGGG